MKRCSKCNILKPLDKYYKSKKSSDGHRSACKKCLNKSSKKYYKKNLSKVKKYQKEYRENNKEKRKKYYKQWREDNKEYLKKYHKKYRNQNKEKLKKQKKRYTDNRKQEKRKYDRKYYQDNKESILKYQENYRKENPKKIKKYQKEYYEENKDKLRQYRKEWRNSNRKWIKKYEKSKFENDPNFKIQHNLRNRINQALTNPSYKSKSTKELLGCSIKELRKWIEEQFEEGMTWNNYGKWHIDHIIPCVKFDLRNSEEQEICFHYTNMQPLWEKDNCKKGEKIIYKI